MQSPLAEASAKGYALLRNWDECAPLDSEQVAAVDLVSSYCRSRSLPDHLSQLPSEHDPESLPETSFRGEEGEVLSSSQAFLEWYTKLDALRVSEAEKKYEDYAAVLSSQLKTCEDVSQLVHDTLGHLNQTLKLFKDAVGKSHALKQTGERLLEEQQQLSVFGEAIRERLFHFEELESIATEFHAVASTVDRPDSQIESKTIFDRFLLILSRLDRCIAYVNSNPQYIESASYETRFRHLHGRALNGILHRVNAVLKAAVQELDPKLSPQNETISEAEETHTYHIKFRALVEEQLQSVFVELTQRSSRPEYHKLFQDCQQAFSKARIALILDTVKRRIDTLHVGTLDALLRDGFTYLIEVCRAERQLFQHFFSKEHQTTAFSSLINTLGTIVYDVVRPKLITVYALDDLCACISILKEEIIQGQLENTEDDVELIQSVVLRTLADAQERLTYRAQAFVQDIVARYEPTNDELESLWILLQTPSETIHLEEPTHERETWYKPLRLVVEALEKLYEALELKIFGGIAHDAILACSLSITKAIPMVSKSRGVMDGQLFAIRHLLIFREELVRFRMEFLITEKDLDFTHMRDHMRRVLSGEVSVFQLSTTSVAQFVTWTAPRVTDTQIDSKKRLEKQLKESCETLIMMVTKSIVEPLLAFLTKVSSLGNQLSEGGKRLPEHAFASPERLADIVREVNHGLDVDLPEIVQKMRTYLPRQGTFSTLYKPIKANIIDAHAQISAILERQYHPAERQSIPLKPKDDLVEFMDAL